VIVILATTLTGSLALAQQHLIPEVSRGKGVAQDVPSYLMYAYIDGKRVELTQDFGFVAIGFAQRPILKDARHAYYKKMRLVVSELNDPALLERELFVVRLTPGADEGKWNVFAQFMRSDRELRYVGRVFSRPDPAHPAVKELLVSAPEIAVQYREPASPERARQEEGRYLIRFERVSTPDGAAIFAAENRAIDPVDLADRMHETGEYKSVSPVFVRVAGQPATPEARQEVIEGYIKSAPEDVKAKWREEAEKRKNAAEGKTPPEEPNQSLPPGGPTPKP